MGRIHVLRSGVLGLLVACGAGAAFVHADEQPGRRVYLTGAIAGLQFDRSDRALALFGPSVGSDSRSTVPAGAMHIDVRTGALSDGFTIPNTPCEAAIDLRAHRAVVTVTRDVLALGADSIAEDVHIFDLDTGRRLRSMVLSQPTRADLIAARRPDGWSYGCDNTHIAVDEGAGRAFVVHNVAYVNGRPAPLITMLDTRTGGYLRTIHLPPSATRVAVAPSIALFRRTHHAFVLAMAGSDLWTLDTRTGNTVHTTVIGNSDWHASALDDTSNTLVVGTGGATRGHVVVVDMRNGRRLRTIAVGAEPTEIALDGPRRRAFLLVDHTTLYNPWHAIEILDLRNGRIIRTVPFGMYWSQTYDARSGRLYVLATALGAIDRREIDVLDGTTGAVLKRMTASGTDRGIAVTPDGRRVLVTGSASCSFSLPVVWSCDDQRGIVTIVEVRA